MSHQAARWFDHSCSDRERHSHNQTVPESIVPAACRASFISSANFCISARPAGSCHGHWPELTLLTIERYLGLALGGARPGGEPSRLVAQSHLAELLTALRGQALPLQPVQPCNDNPRRQGHSQAVRRRHGPCGAAEWHKGGMSAARAEKSMTLRRLPFVPLDVSKMARSHPGGRDKEEVGPCAALATEGLHFAAGPVLLKCGRRTACCRRPPSHRLFKICKT